MVGRRGSEKTEVIRHLFFDRYEEATGELSDPVVTQDDVTAAIRATGASLRPDNPANFFKDFVRKHTRNANWPADVFDAGYTAQQKAGEDAVLEFIRIPAGQTTAFPINAPIRKLVESPVPLQSISMSPTARRLGRADESWITSVVDDLNVIHTHLALQSSERWLHLARLQTNVKLGRSEVDVLYLGIVLREDDLEEDVLVTCETKSRGEELEEEQISRGAHTALESARRALGRDVRVVPTAVKVLSGKDWEGGPDTDGLLWVVEYLYDPENDALEKANEGVYELVPPVKGINLKRPRSRRSVGRRH